jgi:hypothetical protein
MHIPEYECRSLRPLEFASCAIRRIGQPQSDARDYTAKYEALIIIVIKQNQPTIHYFLWPGTYNDLHALQV